MSRNTDLGVPTLPHSWPLDGWHTDAPGVFPGTLSRARQPVRYHREALDAAGALVRVGRKIVVLGAAYHARLAAQASRVENFQRPLNDETHRAKPGAAAF
jgi:hypothetical protein